MIDQINIRRLDEMTGPNPPEATEADPQTGGDLWWTSDMKHSDDVWAGYGFIRAGQWTGAHKHPRGTHYTTITKGVGLLYMQGEMHVLHAGDAVEIPENTLHAFGATDDQDLWVFDVSQPAWSAENIQFEPELDETIATAFDNARAEHAARV
jgi:mannose-6-phosphate isomerase-like protein (cupin superfamily)